MRQEARPQAEVDPASNAQHAADAFEDRARCIHVRIRDPKQNSGPGKEGQTPPMNIRFPPSESGFHSVFRGPIRWPWARAMRSWPGYKLFPGNKGDPLE